MTAFRDLSSCQNPSPFIPSVLPWLHEAGAAYFDWIFGGHDAARRILASWMTRRSSEVSISRVTLLLDGGRAVGGFVAVGGVELARCRKADALAVISSVSASERQDLLARISTVRGLFPVVQPDEFYLSKMGVAADRRAGGLGRALVAEYVDVGRAAGFRRFRLDVSTQNQAAVTLYRSCGFAIARESASADTRIGYLAMVRTCEEPLT